MRREIIPGETVIFNVMGGMDTLMGPAAGAAFFPPAEGLLAGVLRVLT
jgi:ABC-type branched-subunit amino acid transport system permease subunit